MEGGGAPGRETHEKSRQENHYYCHQQKHHHDHGSDCLSKLSADEWCRILTRASCALGRPCEETTRLAAASQVWKVSVGKASGPVPGRVAVGDLKLPGS